MDVDRNFYKIVKGLVDRKFFFPGAFNKKNRIAIKLNRHF